jgi:antitoxin (DNA-binding transcriptional repressor) of toxin-antitoxin stability system
MMKPVKIAELKDRLSYYLRRVQRGESILVADRDKVIARIERVTGREAVPAGDAEWSNASSGVASSIGVLDTSTGSGSGRSLS